MNQTGWDAVIVGAGSGGVAVATGLAAAGRRVALVSAGFVGGECAYVACMPSKSLLRSARGRHEAETSVVHGATISPLAMADPQVDWASALRRRDSVAAHRDDSAEAQSITDKGITIIKGTGVLAGPGRVSVGSDVLEAKDIVLAGGSTPVVPPLDGLADVPHWTSDQALSSSELPGSLIILGGGPIGCELAQVYARFGSEVTVVESAERVLPNEDAIIGDAMAAVLQNDGVIVMTGVEATAVAPSGDGLELFFRSGLVAGDRLLLVTGRRPATDGLELGSVGITSGEHGEVVVDLRCRAGEHLWAVGDITGTAPFTHTATHQARVVVDEILGNSGHDMTPDSLPRAVYTEPPCAGVGLTEAQARDRGHDVVIVDVDLCEVSRAGAEGEGPLGPKNSDGGFLRLVADRSQRRLIGAAAIGAAADSWITEATLAIRAHIPLEVLADVVRPFPTFAEAYTIGYLRLLDRLDG